MKHLVLDDFFYDDNVYTVIINSTDVLHIIYPFLETPPAQWRIFQISDNFALSFSR